MSTTVERTGCSPRTALRSGRTDRRGEDHARGTLGPATRHATRAVSPWCYGAYIPQR